MKFKRGDSLVYKNKINKRKADFKVIDIKDNRYILICQKSHKTIDPLVTTVETLLELLKKPTHPLTRIFE